VADVRCTPVSAAKLAAESSAPKSNNESEAGTETKRGGAASEGAKAAKAAMAAAMVATGRYNIPAAAAAAAAAGAGGSVRRMHRPTPAEFRTGPAATREPVVLTGLDIGPAPWLWWGGCTIRIQLTPTVA
jgi:hypothetical protein